MRQMALAAVVASALFSAAWAQQAKALTADDFRLHLSPIREWTQSAGPQSPNRFAGTIVGAWQRRFPGGEAVVYVIGTRREGQYMLDQVAGSFAEFLAAEGVEAEQFGNFSALGREAAKFTMSGPGTGQMIAALSERLEAKTPTYMEVVLTTNLWHNGRGTDFIQFVLGCPASAKKEGIEALQTVVHKAFLLGQFAGTETEARDEEEDEEEEPVVEETVEPTLELRSTLEATRRAAPAAAGPSATPTAPTDEPPPAEEPAAEPTAAVVTAEPTPEPAPPSPPETATPAEATPEPTETPDPQPAPEPATDPPVRAPATLNGILFGSLYNSAAPVPRPIAVQFLSARREGVDVRWHAGRDDRTDVYVCIWADMRAVWIVPAEAFKTMASGTGDGYELGYSEAMAPYLGQWSNLWDPEQGR